MNTALQLAPTGNWSRTRLDLPERLSFDDWVSVGQRLRTVDAAVWWWLGDWVAFGEHEYADRIGKAAELTGHPVEKLKEARKVSAAYPPHERIEAVSWTNHKIALQLPRELRAGVLRQAEESKWTTRDMRFAVSRILVGVVDEHSPALPMPEQAQNYTRRVGVLIEAAFRDWFGLGEEYARVLLGLYKAGGKPQGWRDLAKFVSTHQPMTRGALHEAISTLREVFESEAIDRDEDGYWMTDVGMAECRQAFRDLAGQLQSIGLEPANEA